MRTEHLHDHTQDNTYNIMNLRKFFSKKKDMVSFKELLSIPSDTVSQIDPEDVDSITTVKVKNNDSDNVTLRVTMKKGKLWDKHFHDCKETIVMYKGKIKDVITGKEIGRGAHLSIPAERPHSIEALEDTIFYVEFQKV